MKIFLQPTTSSKEDKAGPFKEGQPLIFLTHNRAKELVFKSCTFIKLKKPHQALVSFHNLDTDKVTERLVPVTKLRPCSVIGDRALFEPLVEQKITRHIRNYMRAPIRIGSVIEFRTPIPPATDPNHTTILKNSKRIGVVVEHAKLDKHWYITVEDANSNRRYLITLQKIIRVLTAPALQLNSGKEN